MLQNLIKSRTPMWRGLQTQETDKIAWDSSDDATRVFLLSAYCCIPPPEARVFRVKTLSLTQITTWLSLMALVWTDWLMTWEEGWSETALWPWGWGQSGHLWPTVTLSGFYLLTAQRLFASQDGSRLMQLRNKTGSKPEKGNRFIFLQTVQTGSGAYVAPYSMGTGGASPSVKRPGRVVDHSPLSTAEF
jgi:hypothetical protein